MNSYCESHIPSVIWIVSILILQVLWIVSISKPWVRIVYSQYKLLTQSYTPSVMNSINLQALSSYCESHIPSLDTVYSKSWILWIVYRKSWILWIVYRKSWILWIVYRKSWLNSINLQALSSYCESHTPSLEFILWIAYSKCCSLIEAFFNHDLYSAIRRIATHCYYRRHIVL